MTPEIPSGDGGNEDIPQILHSVFEQGPFTKCVDCGTDLLSDGRPYGIEKVVRQGEVVLEYAVCPGCIERLMREYSQESMEKIQEYLESGELPGSLDADPHRCQQCGLEGERFSEEHTVIGVLVGRQVLMGPGALCWDCVSGLDDALSQKTRDVHGDWMTRNFPGVPDARDLPVSVLGGG